MDASGIRDWDEVKALVLERYSGVALMPARGRGLKA
jgi:hypothetical protein